jgi:hypothetical protein
MKANPDKFQALAIGKKSFDHKIVFELKGNRIECENDVKLLGVNNTGPKIDLAEHLYTYI